MDKKIKLINLQYGDVSTDLLELKESYGVEVLQCATVDNMNDLDGLASLIDVCDLVVSSDNSTVHLAGALGKQVWVCLPDPPNWRWGLSGDSSDWYPNVRLYRQQNLGDWTSVLLDLSQSLMKYEN